MDTQERIGKARNRAQFSPKDGSSIQQFRADLDSEGPSPIAGLAKSLGEQAVQRMKMRSMEDVMLEDQDDEDDDERDGAVGHRGGHAYGDDDGDDDRDEDDRDEDDQDARQAVKRRKVGDMSSESDLEDYEDKVEQYQFSDDDEDDDGDGDDDD